MTSPTSSLVVRLDPDLNWWLEPDPSTTDPAPAPRGVLDPRQVQALVEQFREHQPHGLTKLHLTEAFSAYTLSSELEDGLVRLESVRADWLNGVDLFALPVLDEDGDGPYADFLDALSCAHVARLNATHHYARNCSVDDLREELDVMDHDRYFSTDAIHPFDEINEILQWHPAAWDEP